MTRERIGWALVVVVAALLVYWVARNTYWTTVKVPLPPRGEAATNPFYVQEKFAQALGARAHWARDLRLPPTSGVASVAMLDWDLLPDRRQRLEHWVESGGRLLVDGSLITGHDEFATWTGIAGKARTPENKKQNFKPTERCSPHNETGSQDSYLVCEQISDDSLDAHRKLLWGLRDRDSNLMAARVAIGHGSVTIISGTPFSGRSLFAGENARLFVTATQLRRGDVIHFFSENDQASLFELAWRLGWPVLGLILIVLALAIWRGSVRFGPLAPPTQTARRSLAEQIRGTGQFTMRIGSARALHAATARALNEAAVRYINTYETLPGAERMQALAKTTGYEANALAAALNYSGSGRTDSLRGDLELLEAARRRILLVNMRSKHGN